MANNAVEVNNLVKTYPRVKAVDDISFNIREGEVFGLLGPNGAGKTTTIRMLLTLVKPTSGTIHIFGINTMTDPGKVRQLAGYVPQDVSVDGELTGYENMLMYAKLYDVPRSTRQNLIAEAMNYMELSDRADDMVNKYSGGMMRRLEIAQTLVNRPKILYLDEPSIGLDPSARRMIWEHIEKLRLEFGTTILITTHDMNEADRLCNRIGIMDRGKLITVGEPSRLKAAIGGDMVSIKSQTPGFTQKLKELGYPVIPKPSNGDAELIMTDGEKQIPDLLSALHSNGISVEAVSLKKPTLDDVFLHFSGSHIEQDDTSAQEGGSYAQTRKTRRTFRRLS
jgi:ABC-2 type transport system ATP-binding protein